jgi:predicted O-methyltransferase YrrM
VRISILVMTITSLAYGQLACGRSDAQQAQSTDDARAQAAYDRYRRPDLVVAGLDLREGHVVADVGAGLGYLTPRLAAAVGARGRVVATDVDPTVFATLVARAKEANVADRVTTRVVAPDDPGLEAGTYDRILLAQVDHLLEDRAGYFRRLVPALTPEGRIAISNRLPHRERVLGAARDAGLTLRSETELPGQFLLVFEVPR